MTRLGDGDVRGTLRDIDIGLNQVAFRGDEAALVIDREIAGTCIGGFPRRHEHLEISFALNGKVVGVAGQGVTALFHNAVDASGLDAGTDLDTCRDNRTRIRGLCAHALDILVEEVLEFGALLFEAHRIHVGNVIGDDFNIHLLSGHAGCGGS